MSQCVGTGYAACGVNGVPPSGRVAVYSQCTGVKERPTCVCADLAHPVDVTCREMVFDWCVQGGTQGCVYGCVMVAAAFSQKKALVVGRLHAVCGHGVGYTCEPVIGEVGGGNILRGVEWGVGPP